MGKRNTKWSYRTYLRFLKNGRGKGDLGDYKPWITTHDFPSKGKVARILGKKTNRIHHLMSQLEKTYFLILDNDPLVEDIKEQFPLPLDMTQLIAARMGIKHPCVNGFSYVMTTDFMVKRDGVWQAIQVKTSEDAEKDRVKEKFAIEKAYYKMTGVGWSLLTEKDLPPTVAGNYLWLNAGESFERLVSNPGKRIRMKLAFLELYRDYTIPFRTILATMDDICAVRAGTTMQLFKSCILGDEIAFNPFEPVSLEEPRMVGYGIGREQYGW